ncbi:MAG: hypothetical protein QW666_03550 [Candidatus Woesearchaeota archaeon]
MKRKTKTESWEIVDINLEEVKKQIFKSKAIQDTVLQSGTNIDDEVDNLARKIEKFSKDMLKIAKIDDSYRPVLKNTENNTTIAFDYDPIKKSFNFLNSGGQGFLVFGKVPLDDADNQKHAYVTLRAYEKASEDIKKPEHIGKPMVDLLRHKQTGTKLELKNMPACKIETYVDGKIGHLFPNGKCLVKMCIAKNEDSAHLVKREGVMQGLLHRNLAYMFAQGKLDSKTSDWYYAVLEYVKVTQNLNFKDKFGAIEQVLTCIEEALLPAGIVHRDIKPDNILTFRLKDVEKKWPKHITEKDKDPDGNQYKICAKLTDTGLIKTLRQDAKTNQTIKGLFLGTVDFAAPEDAAAADSGDATHRPSWYGDLYSTGASLYYYLTDFSPNQAENPDDTFSLFKNLAEGRFKILRPSETKNLHSDLVREYFGDEKRIKQVGYWIDLVIAGMMQREKKHRYCRISDCIKDLCAVKNGREPVNIKNRAKQLGMKEEDYIKAVFTHVQPNMPSNAYYDKEGAERRENGSWLRLLFGF